MLHRKVNRDKNIKPKGGIYWCGKCDRDKVGKGQKCATCGARPPQKSLKKETNAR